MFVVYLVYWLNEDAPPWPQSRFGFSGQSAPPAGQTVTLQPSCFVVTLMDIFNYYSDFIGVLPAWSNEEHILKLNYSHIDILKTIYFN